MKFFYLLLIPLALISCEKENICTDCKINLDKEEGLNLVKKEIEGYSCLTNIYLGKFNGQTVYVASVVDPACLTDGTVGVYNCAGDFLQNIKPGEDLQIGELIVSNKK